MQEQKPHLAQPMIALWHTLTMPRSTAAELARCEYMTKAVSLIMAVMAGGLTVLFGVGWRVYRLPFDSLLITLAMTVLFSGGWRLADRGYWRLAGFFPPVMMLAAALYGNWIGGAGAPAMVLYALAIALAATLQGVCTQWIVLAISIVAYVGIGWATLTGYITQARFLETTFANRVIIVVGAYISLAGLLWFLVAEFQRVLTKAHAYTEQLAAINRTLTQEIEERKQAEAAVREKHSFLQQLIDSTMDHIYAKDRASRFLIANQGTIRSLGAASLDEVLNKTDRDFHSPEKARLFWREERLVIESGQPLINREESYSDRATGALRWVLTTKIPLCDPQGNIIGLVGFNRDITDRKRTEEALRESEVRFALFMEHLPAIVFIKDAESRTLYVNQYMNDMLGAKDWIGKTALEFFPPEAAHAMIADDRTVLAEGSRVIVETVPDRHGAPHIYQTHKFRIDRPDQPPLLGGIAVDITERKQAEEELARTQILLEETFEQSPVPLALVSMPDAVIRMVNPACREFLGVLDEPSPVGVPLLNFQPSYQDNDRHGKPGTVAELPLARALRGETIHNEERQIVRKDGTLRWELVNATPIRNPQGDLIAGYLILVDITERKQTEEALRALNAELEQRVHDRTAKLEAANRELQSFAYVVSHDLKAPLRAISRLVTWLVTDYAGTFDAKGHEMADLLVGRVKRMDALIDGILEYSRIGRIVGQNEAVDLNHLLPDVIDLLAPPPSIRIEIAPQFPHVIGDKIRIQQVFQNLIGNAIKFMDKPQGEITVNWSDDGAFWRFSVADNGPGIDPKYHDKIFQIFQTLHPRDEVESTGIGLSIVKKIVELYGGKIWVESTVGQGSTFYFTWQKAETI